MAKMSTLDEFVAEQKRLLDLFRAHWLKQQDKGLFPGSLPNGDWDEQFGFFKDGAGS
jgi:hypothetical protein